MIMQVRKPHKKQRRNPRVHNKGLAHGNCKYHIVFAPKYRRQVMYGKIEGKYYENYVSKSAEDNRGIETISLYA